MTPTLTVRPAPASRYGHKAGLWLVESRRDDTGDEDRDWCIPMWDERGAGSLSGPFATRPAAQAAINAWTGR